MLRVCSVHCFIAIAMDGIQNIDLPCPDMFLDFESCMYKADTPEQTRQGQINFL